ncbi:unnamed protein product [Clonostachys solani]|uniref:Uncharacterized protein n=1 Tax=Clonostachys solani TaxID=160281 RepID=A0A9N9ZIR7_9HYPO|nr:unnamed protein product [Clonostachys solani]
MQLPIDADDDLIESTNIDSQVLRGMSEVSAQLRKTLYRKPANHTYGALQASVEPILEDLSNWRVSFPMLVSPRSVYETTHWRDLNFYRERLKCFRPFILLGKENDAPFYRDSLHACQEASSKVASLYMDLRTSDKLVLNWTCVHDMMSAGFTMLFCALLSRDLLPPRDRAIESTWVKKYEDFEQSVACILDTLSHIAERWPTVERHVSVFKALANRVTDSVRPGATSSNDEGAWPRMMGPAGPFTQSEDMAQDSEILGHQAEVWDAAMVSFLNEPFDLGSINWGTVEWDSSDLLDLM